MGEIDNKRLEELLKIESQDLTKEQYHEFLIILKESQFLMPIDITSGLPNFEDLEVGQTGTLDEPLRFKPVIFKDDLNRSIIPLFTNNEELTKTGAKFQAFGLFSQDLANMLKNKENIDEICINPFSRFSINIHLDDFLNLFFVENKFENIFNKLKALEEIVVVYFREEKPFLKQNAQNGIYVDDLPFRASLDSDFKKHLPYLNVLFLSPGTKMIYLDENVDSNEYYDIVLEPKTELELLDENDENTMFWVCGKSRDNIKSDVLEFLKNNDSFKY